MKNKKYILIFVFLFIVILIVGLLSIKQLNDTEETGVNEITPQEEIGENTQTKDTIVIVYFPNKETGELVQEARVVDVREIINNPYQKLIELLMSGPVNDKLEKVIPNNTVILGTNIQDGCLTINFSSEILNYNQEIGKETLINSIVNTLTELTEVDKVKIIIEGIENDEFSGEYTRKT